MVALTLIVLLLVCCYVLVLVVRGTPFRAIDLFVIVAISVRIHLLFNTV